MRTDQIMPAMKYALPLIALLTLSACGQITSGGAIRVVSQEIPGTHAAWQDSSSTIFLGAVPPRYALSHELCHVVDSRGISYATALRMIQPTNAPGQDIARLVLAEVANHSGPDAHWKALRVVCGVHAVAHPEIIARIK